MGGAQQSVSYLAQELVQSGLDVTIGYGEGNFLKEKNKNLTIKLINFKHLKRSLNPISNLLLIWEMKKYLEKNETDVLHLNSSNTLFCAIAGKIARNKPRIIFTFRGMSLLDKNYTKNYLKKKIIILIYKFLLKFVDQKVFVSTENREYGETIGLTKNSTVIYNGLPKLKYWDKDEAKNYLSNKYQLDLKNKFIIGSIGRLAYQKNYEFLITASKQFLNENTILLIIGSGPEKEKYYKLIKESKQEYRIFILEGIDDAYRFMKAFDVFTLTSRYEGMSITLLEALQAALPIIASDVGGNRETLQDCGILYPLDDQQDFVKKVKKLASEDKLRIDLSKKAGERFNNFFIKNTAQKYKEIYNT